MLKYQSSKLIASIVGGVSMISSFIAPIVLFTAYHNWGSLLLLLVYPVVVGLCAVLRHKGIQGEGILFLASAFALSAVKYMNTAMYLAYCAIVLGIVSQYHLQFYTLPSLEKDMRYYSSLISDAQ